MITEVLLPTDTAISKAIDILKNGGLVGMPTETVYGLAADAMNQDGVLSIFATKGRPADNPLIVHVDKPESAERLCFISKESRELMERFCPGPLTLLMPKKDCILPVVNAGLDSVAIRIPSHPVAHRLLRESGLAIAAPSANTSGKPSPTTSAHVLHDLNGVIPLILEGGECQVGLESTVVDMAHGIPTVLRPGAVTPEMLLTVLPEVKIADSILRPLKEGEKALSPGMRYRHYAPYGHLELVRGEEEDVAKAILRLWENAPCGKEKARILAFDEHLHLYPSEYTVSIGSINHPETVMHKLFGVLREMDDQHIELMYGEILEAVGYGLAIMNRLSRAAAFDIHNAEEILSDF